MVSYIGKVVSCDKRVGVVYKEKVLSENNEHIKAVVCVLWQEPSMPKTVHFVPHEKNDNGLSRFGLIFEEKA